MLIQARDLSKQYAPEMPFILDKVNFKVVPGAKISLMGPSGSGKSTLLNLLGLLDKPTQGCLFWENKAIDSLSSKQICSIRNRDIGFVFQRYCLLEKRSVLDNIALPLWYSGLSLKESEKKVRLLLGQMGLASYEKTFPPMLSGGQQQRICVARALAMRPKLLLADEPTGALDCETRDRVWSYFEMANEEWGTAILISTHDNTLASSCSEQWTLQGAKVCCTV